MFGAHIRELRLAKGLTQGELGARMDREKQSIHRIESGDISASVFYLYKLSKGLEVDMPELLAFNTDVKSGKKKAKA
jgi:putative transcriptional regulator